MVSKPSRQVGVPHVAQHEVVAGLISRQLKIEIWQKILITVEKIIENISVQRIIQNIL